MTDSTVGQNIAPMYTTIGAGYSFGGFAAGVKPSRGEYYHIAGVTKNNGSPAARTVHLVDIGRGNQVVECQKTGSDGVFDFKYLRQGVYTVIGVNEDGSQNDVIYANVSAVAMS